MDNSWPAEFGSQWINGFLLCPSDKHSEMHFLRILSGIKRQPSSVVTNSRHTLRLSAFPSSCFLPPYPQSSSWDHFLHFGSAFWGESRWRQGFSQRNIAFLDKRQPMCLQLHESLTSGTLPAAYRKLECGISECHITAYFHMDWFTTKF